MEESWKYFTLKKSIHETNNNSFLVTFFDNTFKILVFNKFNEYQLYFENDQNLSIFSQYEIVNNFNTVDFYA